MSQQMRLNLSISAVVLLSVLPSVEGQGKKPIASPPKSTLSRIVGNEIEVAIEHITWEAQAPQQTNLFIYSVKTARFDEALLNRLANKFSLTGQVSRIREAATGQSGFSITDTNSSIRGKNRTVYFWESTGNFGYDTGDDGYRFNTSTKRHEVFGVPEKEEAKKMALELLPVLGFSTNDLEHYSNGRVRWASSGKTITYTDKEDKQRKSIITARSVTFYQRVSGGTTTGMGDGGQLRFSFVTGGKLARIECFFRATERAGEAKPKTQEQIVEDIRKQKATTWLQRVPLSLTITNCVLAYPQGNSWLHQDYIWPFYMINGSGPSGEAVTRFISLSE